MSFVPTHREQTVKTHTVQQAAEVFKQIQFDNKDTVTLPAGSQLETLFKTDPTKKITMVELNDLVDSARKAVKRGFKSH